MDILNFISWIRGRRQVTTVDPAKTLIPVGLKDGRRDDEYLAGAITVQDLAAQIAPQPAYKVYTALLTQSGGDIAALIGSGTVQQGVSYSISGAPSTPGPAYDFTNIGAPNNDIGTWFVATTSIEPISWNGAVLKYNTGAPVVTVLENTLGFDIVWYYEAGGGWYTFQNNTTGVLFDKTKTWINTPADHTYDNNSTPGIYRGSESPVPYIGIITSTDDVLINYSIEIRVYN